MVHDLIMQRRSLRAIDPYRKVEKHLIIQMLEAARWAPSCSNNQPWRFVVPEDDLLEKVKDCLTKGNAWALNASHIIVVASKPEFDCQIRGRDYYTLGIGLAVENLLLQGTALNLVVHPIAGFDESRLKDVLGLPGDFMLHVCIPIGYPDHIDDLEKWTTEQEKGVRLRKSLDEIVFWGKWSNKSK